MLSIEFPLLNLIYKKRRSIIISIDIGQLRVHCAHSSHSRVLPQLTMQLHILCMCCLCNTWESKAILQPHTHLASPPCPPRTSTLQSLHWMVPPIRGRIASRRRNLQLASIQPASRHLCSIVFAIHRSGWALTVHVQPAICAN